MTNRPGQPGASTIASLTGRPLAAQPELIAQAHARSRQVGLRASESPDFHPLREAALRDLVERKIYPNWWREFSGYTVQLKTCLCASPRECSRILTRHDGNISALARELGLARNTVYRYLRRSRVH
jgi:transcriptional regulator of acetoin/glycerol metabolism